MLTDAQRQQYEEVLKTSERQREEGSVQGRPGRVWIRNADGMPQPIALVVGSPMIRPPRCSLATSVRGKR